MIIEVDPLVGGFEVPYNGAFTLRFASSFTEGELATADLKLYGMALDGSTAELDGDPEGTDILFVVPAQTFSPGLWELNPRATIAGTPREFAVAIGMNVLDRGVSRYPKRAGATVPFQ